MPSIKLIFLNQNEKNKLKLTNSTAKKKSSIISKYFHYILHIFFLNRKLAKKI